MRHRVGSEDGTVSSLVAVLAIGIVAVAGLAFDGGAIITATAHARDVAAGAARAGTQAVSLSEIHAGRTGLDAAAAEGAAMSFLDAAGVGGVVAVAGSTVTVTVTLDQPMRLLPLPDRQISATATARAVSDVLEEVPS